VSQRPYRRVLAVAATAAALTLAGCAADTTPAAPAAPTAPSGATTAVEPAEQTVAWTNSVCGAVVPVAESLVNPPAFDVTAPAATRDGYLEYLGNARAATDTALQQVTAAGSAPVDGGEQVAKEVRDQLTELRDDLTDARNQIEQADPNDATAVGRFAVAAANVVGAVGNTAQALSALDGNPQLDAAFEQAQSCQQLRSVQTPGRPGTG
jgi:hypothetical protein